MSAPSGNASPALSSPGVTQTPDRARTARLGLAALGIVFGDIGTSPLYAVRQCFFGSTPLPVTQVTVLGVLSLILWSLILVISVKYLLLVMRADNRGEGGILALLALLDPWGRSARKGPVVLILLGVFGAALLYGDGMLTPAISVLSAIEGLEVATPATTDLVLPATLIILVLLFAFQKRGTGRIGAVFGPIMVVWFVLLAVLGVVGIFGNPSVLAAVNPLAAVAFFARDPGFAFIVLGAVFLVVTGGEALYADMGHFGRAPIRLAWFALVLPALLLNYFGQGAYILDHAGQAHHPFYNLVPHWAVYPMIGLATVVTVIASQAVISGTFSLTRQAIQLGQSPRMTVVQTSPDEIGQIYVPAVNWALMVATAALVIGFGSSSNLAAAYGIAVSATMVITTVLAFFVMRDKWGWPKPVVWTVVCFFLVFDLSFLGANLLKVVEGGWVPLAVASGALLLMTTWRRGRTLLAERVRARSMPIDVFLSSIKGRGPQRIPGTAVFLCNPGDNVPSGLLHHLKLNTVLHEQVLLVTAITEEVPRVPAANRFDATELEGGFYRVIVHYGFMQSPNLPVAMKLLRDRALVPTPDFDTLVYYADRTTLIPNATAGGLPTWRKRLFAFMSHNSQRAAEYYRLPPGSSVELGIKVEL